MEQKPIFNLNSVSPRAGLFEQVIARIHAKQQASALWRIRISVGVAVASIAGLIPVVKALATGFATSNFSTYLSLVFSDTSIALSHWREIGASLLEAVPAAALTMTLALVVVLLWSMRTAIRSFTTRSLISHA